MPANEDKQDQAKQPSWLESPEFKAAVASAAAEAVSKALAQVGALTPPAAMASADGLDLMRQLSLNIAQLTSQDSGRQHIDPAVIQARETARTRMFELIAEARRNGDEAVYVLVGKVWLDNQIVEPMWVRDDKVVVATEVIWLDVPNDAMRPVNHVAKEIHAAYIESVGNGHKEFAPIPEYGVNTAGLVVKGRGIPKSAGRRTPADDARDWGESGLKITNHNGARYEQKRILGTIVPPALQTVN